MIELLPTLAVMAVGGLTSVRKLHMATAPAGRILLHVLCAARDHRFSWHWRGVARELAPAAAIAARINPTC